MSLKVFVEMSGSYIVDVGRVKEDFIRLRPDGCEVVVWDLGAEGVAYGFFDLVSCCLLSHPFRVF